MRRVVSGGLGWRRKFETLLPPPKIDEDDNDDYDGEKSEEDAPSVFNTYAIEDVHNSLERCKEIFAELKKGLSRASKRMKDLPVIEGKVILYDRPDIAPLESLDRKAPIGIIASLSQQRRERRYQPKEDDANDELDEEATVNRPADGPSEPRSKPNVIGPGGNPAHDGAVKDEQKDEHTKDSPSNPLGPGTGKEAFKESSGHPSNSPGPRPSNRSLSSASSTSSDTYHSTKPSAWFKPQSTLAPVARRSIKCLTYSLYCPYNALLICFCGTVDESERHYRSRRSRYSRRSHRRMNSMVGRRRYRAPLDARASRMSRPIPDFVEEPTIVDPERKWMRRWRARLINYWWRS
ncbi:hypothetical protein K469DRAFT_747393 [Zopfia rhizophila CBS 207.26]|uniref:Uncharacterized protein n=1 Tax=Zopfia rhizophila CBS 207.26 TaxID=1314779 RepID=A0A6A6EJT2_9PEZI|nr:hypothetical protein K469DRAFT_747393 [Zopfia rhizophila CBS 207.26]